MPISVPLAGYQPSQLLFESLLRDPLFFSKPAADLWNTLANTSSLFRPSLGSVLYHATQLALQKADNGAKSSHVLSLLAEVRNMHKLIPFAQEPYVSSACHAITRLLTCRFLLLWMADRYRSDLRGADSCWADSRVCIHLSRTIKIPTCFFYSQIPFTLTCCSLPAHDSDDPHRG